MRVRQAHADRSGERGGIAGRFRGGREPALSSPIWSLSIYTSKGVETLPHMRHEGATRCVIPCPPVAIRRLCHRKEHSNVFVESCRAHGAHGNGSAFRTAACFAPHRREQSTSGAGRAAHISNEQEVRHSRSRIPVLPHSLIVNQQAPPSFAFATMRGSEKLRGFFSGEYRPAFIAVSIAPPVPSRKPSRRVRWRR
jgi:hypothetical protein